MESELIKSAMTQGFWAVLFVVLLLYVLKENSKREENYQSIISKLSEEIYQDLKEIKNKIFR